MSKSHVICIGEALIDRIINKSESKFKNYLGGAPANVACALSKLNVPTTFIGCLGDDDYGKEFIRLFQKLNININLLQINKTASTRLVKVLRDKSGDRSFAGFENPIGDYYADEMLDKYEIQENVTALKKLFLNAKYIITGSNILISDKSSESLYQILNYAKEFNIKLVVDANWRDIFWDHSNTKKDLGRVNQLEIVRNLLNNADILKLSSEEAKLFFKDNDPSKISESLIKKPDVIITDGCNPIRWYINGIKGSEDVVRSAQIIDTTGAGDAFLAGFISRLCNQSNLMDQSIIKGNIQFASVCGLLTCLGEGAIEQQPNKKDVDQLLKTLGSDI